MLSWIRKTLGIRQGTAVFKKVSVKLPFKIGEAEWEAGTTEGRAAWLLYVELVKRVAMQSLEVDRGLVRKVLNSLSIPFYKRGKQSVRLS